MFFSIEAASYYDGFLWYSSNEINGLYKFDLKSSHNERIITFPDEELFAKYLHRKCFLVGTKMFFLPSLAQNVHIYDIHERRMDSVSFGENVIDAILIDNKIWMICGEKYSDLFVLDTEKYEITKICEFKKQCEKYINLSRNSLTRRLSLAQEKICFGVLGGNQICEWDIKKEKLLVHNTEIEDIFAAFCIDDKYWVVDRNSANVYCVDNNKFSKYEPSLNCNNRVVPSRFYNNICKYGEGVLVIPAFSNKYVFIGDDSLFLYDFGFENSEKEQYKDYVKINDDILILPYGNKDFVYFHSNGEKEIIVQPIENNAFIGINKSDIPNILFENTEIGLNEFIDLIL